MQQQLVNLNQLVADHLQSSRRTVGDKITVNFMAEVGLEDVYADPAQIDQVLTFLFDNVNSMIPDGGELILLTRKVRRNPFVLLPDSMSGSDSYIMLSVIETGDRTDDSSIDEVIESRSTAGSQEAAASELSIVSGIVKGRDGRMKVRAVAGEDTTFQFFFPPCVS